MQGERSFLPSPRAFPAIVVLALLWLAMLTLGAGAADDTILRALYAGSHPALVALARGVTFVGTGWVAIPAALIAVALLWRQRGKRAALAALAVIVAGRLLVEAQKYAIGRLRPEGEVHLVAVSTPSFPSGHAANSMILCLIVALFFFGDTPWRRTALAVALLLSFLIGLSRSMLGVHWPTDVIGGWAFGMLWVLAATPVAERAVRM